MPNPADVLDKDTIDDLKGMEQHNSTAMAKFDRDRHRARYRQRMDRMTEKEREEYAAKNSENQMRHYYRRKAEAASKAAQKAPNQGAKV